MLERFDTYVYFNSNVTVETDHKPLLAIHKKALAAAPKRLQRMLLRLQRYKYELVYRPGTELLIADTLSRAYPEVNKPEIKISRNGCTFWEELAELVDNESGSHLELVANPKTIAMLKTAANNDPVYSMLKEQIAVGWPSTPNELPAELKSLRYVCGRTRCGGRLDLQRITCRRATGRQT